MRTRALPLHLFRLLLAAALSCALAGPSSAAAEGYGEPPEPKDVSLEASDGVHLAGTLYEPFGGGEGKGAVLALHAEGGDRSCWKETGRLLARKGLSLLAIDLRGHGGSRTQGEADLGPRAEAKDPELWKGCLLDAEAGVKHLRGDLLADGKKLGVVGAGAGMAVALCLAEKDERVRAVYGVAPDPSGCGVPGAAAVVRWDGRPLGFVVGSADAKGPSAPLARAMAKHPRSEVREIPSKESLPPGALLAAGPASAEAAQFLLGWLERPRLTGKDEDGVRTGNGIFAGGSSSSVGQAAGGLTFGGYLAPGTVGGIQVLSDPDPKASRLTSGSRRITVVPRKGKVPALQAVVETWGGSGWRKGETVVLLDAGAFVTEGKTTFWQVWLSPGILGVEPFTKCATVSTPLVDGKARWEKGEERSGPSSWQAWDLD